MWDNDQNQSRPLEALLLELHEAERGGVFRSTTVPSVKTVAPEHGRNLVFRLATAGLALAACLALFAFGLTWRTGRHGQLVVNGSSRVVPTSAEESDLAAMRFSGCVAGPASGPLAGDCASADYDGDGDVDLADFRLMQVALPLNM